VALVLVAPVAVYFWLTRETDEVENAIVRIGFDPLVPPNKALILGSFYYVSLDGSHPRPVCTTTPSVVETMVETSPLPEFMASKLVDAHTSIQGEMLRAVKAEAAIEDHLAIEYSFKDTKLFQLNGANLVTLEHGLFEETNCNAAISEYINNVGLVCQVQSALMATVHYVIKRKDGQRIANEDVEKIKGALEATTEMKGMTVRESTIEGLSLFYGIMFKPKCVTNSDDVLVYPQTKTDRIVLHARLLWRRMFS
jgi:hypothetical protein